MAKNSYLLAVEHKDDEVVQVIKVSSYEDREYKSLLNDLEKHKSKVFTEKQKEEEDKQSVLARLDNHDKEISSLQLLIAKNTYDNYVDRGFIDDNEDFQKSFYDYLMSGEEFDFENAPIEFKEILRKVVTL